MFMHNGQKFDINSACVIDDVQYPALWFKDEERRIALGITEAPDDAATVAAAFAASKEALKARATELRWEHETGGVTLPGGIELATGITDQNRITSVIANAQLAGITSVDFKAASGWATESLANVQAIAVVIALHVQACFSAERAHHDAIDALTTAEEVAAYDVTAGWPA